MSELGEKIALLLQEDDKYGLTDSYGSLADKIVAMVERGHTETATKLAAAEQRVAGLAERLSLMTRSHHAYWHFEQLETCAMTPCPENRLLLTPPPPAQEEE